MYTQNYEDNMPILLKKLDDDDEDSGPEDSR